ncbi:hypothetical protein PMAYCL1PPCAC_15484, partial [Pristionchus mayeri]
MGKAGVFEVHLSLGVEPGKKLLVNEAELGGVPLHFGHLVPCLRRRVVELRLRLQISLEDREEGQPEGGVHLVDSVAVDRLPHVGLEHLQVGVGFSEHVNGEQDALTLLLESLALLDILGGELLSSLEVNTEIGVVGEE